MCPTHLILHDAAQSVYTIQAMLVLLEVINFILYIKYIQIKNCKC